jgi:hypothetical protein
VTVYQKVIFPRGKVLPPYTKHFIEGKIKWCRGGKRRKLLLDNLMEIVRY